MPIINKKIQNRLKCIKAAALGIYYTKLTKASIYSTFYQNLERNIPAFQLPSIEQDFKGKLIHSLEDWQHFRTQILDFYKEYVYGAISPDIYEQESTFNVHYETIDRQYIERNEKILQIQSKVTFSTQWGSRSAYYLIFLPIQSTEQRHSVPMFVALNFKGNQMVFPYSKMVKNPHLQLKHQIYRLLHKREHNKYEWPIQEIIKNGFGLITAYYGDFYLDRPKGKLNSIYSLFSPTSEVSNAGAIAAWAWGYSQLVSYIQNILSFSNIPIYAVGHSRLGKTALWATALDKRISGVFANNSGCLGAALSNRQIGETVLTIRNAFPYWFHSNFSALSIEDYNKTIDQHFLMSTIAPRKLYISSADRDIWADPIGEYRALKQVLPIYRRFGYKFPDFSDFPHPYHVDSSPVGYHIRSGLHNLTSKDWELYLRFLTQNFPVPIISDLNLNSIRS